MSSALSSGGSNTRPDSKTSPPSSVRPSSRCLAFIDWAESLAESLGGPGRDLPLTEILSATGGISCGCTKLQQESHWIRAMLPTLFRRLVEHPVALPMLMAFPRASLRRTLTSSTGSPDMWSLASQKALTQASDPAWDRELLHGRPSPPTVYMWDNCYISQNCCASSAEAASVRRAMYAANVAMCHLFRTVYPTLVSTSWNRGFPAGKTTLRELRKAFLDLHHSKCSYLKRAGRRRRRSESHQPSPDSL